MVLRVLLVEDSLLNQRLMKAQLDTRKSVVTIATNGEEAVDLMANMEFDLVLMDVQMPAMDGLCATRLIRKQEADKSKHTPIIAVTAGIDRESCLEAGMDDYLKKPVRKESLFEKIDQLVAFDPSNG